MSPSGSDRSCRARERQGEDGFTLVEMMMAIVISSILGVTLIRFYKDSYRTFSQQEQIADRNLNGHYLVNKLVEVLQQAGSALPDTGWNVITTSTGKITIAVNPRGAQDLISFDQPPSKLIPVADASLYTNTGNVMLNTNKVLIDYALAGKPSILCQIDQGVGSGGFVKGIKDTPTGDTIAVQTVVDLSPGDKVYGYREDQYLLSGSDLVVRPDNNSAAQMVLAENIDSLGFKFLTRAGAATTSWTTMKSASILVRARTEKKDPKLKPPNYHKISIPMNVMLRNKI
ncbi:MAG: prepilin-type N-terminal cleavage/methylation domain-containing protein [Fibrobacteria bacterium]